MKRCLFLILSLIIILSPINASNTSSLKSEDKQNQIFDLSLKLRDAGNILLNGNDVSPIDIQRADSLTYLLYKDTTAVKVTSEVIGCIALESFNILSGNHKVDYKKLGKALQICHKYDQFHDLYFIIGANAVATYSMCENQNETAEQFYKYELEALKTFFGENPSELKSLCLNNLILLQLMKNDVEGAMLYVSAYLHNQRLLKGISSPEYEESVKLILTFLPHIADRKYATTLLEELISEVEDTHKEYPAYYYELLQTGAALAKKAYDYVKAFELYSRLYSILSPDIDNYYEVLQDIINYCYEAGDYDMMLAIGDKFEEAYKKGDCTIEDLVGISDIFLSPVFDGERNANFYNELCSRMSAYNEITDKCYVVTLLIKLDHPEEAYALSKEILSSEEISFRDEDFELQSNLSQMFVSLGDYDSAMECMKKTIFSLEKLPSAFYSDIIFSEKELLATLLNMTGNIKESLDLMQSLLKETEQRNPEIRFKLQKSILDILISVGRFSEATTLADELLSTPLNVKDRWEVLCDKSNSLISLIDVEGDGTDRNNYMEDLKTAIDEIEDLSDKNFSKDPVKKALKYIYRGTLANLSNDNKKMIEAADSARLILSYREINPKISREYLTTLCVFYIKAEDYDTAEEMLSFPDQGYKNNIEQLICQRFRYEVALGKKDFKKARELYIENTNYITELIKNQFVDLTKGERANYWQIFRRELQDAGKFTEDLDSPSEFAGSVYNLELFSKGLLLNSENAISRFVYSTGDKALIDKFEVFNNLSRSVKINNLLPENERMAMEARVSELEREILERTKLYGEYTTLLNVKWQDIRAALKDNETAIEFVQYNDLNFNKYLGACIVNKELKEPLFIPIGKESEIAVAIEEEFDGSILWKPLSKYFYPQGKVYFSPAGYLHRLPLESCYDTDTDLIRVSSTRVILESGGKDNLRKGECVVFGDIDYGFEIDKETGKRSGEGFVESLPGTKAEIAMLESVWTKGEIKKYDKEKGSKENFISLPHEKISLLHIGTHGYFNQEVKDMSCTYRQPETMLLYRSSDDFDVYLKGSGLIFANYNDSLREKDGDTQGNVLTGEEISGLDFSNLDLAVLSACDTGMGEVSGEGIFGLQRGFKLAGAKTLLISLWKADDLATEKLMTEFYNNLFNKPELGKYKSLEEAKQKVKTTAGWDDPSYWAGFILLDALD